MAKQMLLMSALDDEARLAALKSSGLLTKSVKERVCHLAYTAAQLTSADIAQVNVLDGQLQHHACQWPMEPLQATRPVSESGCQQVVLSEQTLVIPNAMIHPITCDMPWSKAYTAYLGTPIRYRDEVIGSLCVLAGQPRNWTMGDIMAIEGVAHLLMLALD